MFAFVILHYKSINETIKCISNIKNNLNGNYEIIVVDNNSLDNNEIEQIKEYTTHLILLDENVGFAKANNIGCKYAIDNFKPDYLIVINNDIFITQNNFLEIIKENDKKYHFDMLGPWIDSRTGESCNPFPLIYGKENVINEINYCNKLIKIYRNSLLTFMLNIYLNIKHIIKKPIVPVNGKEISLGVGLHGCAIIFSKKYYEKYNNVFYNETFLFHEEEFLYNRLIKDKLTSLYDPNLKVFHQEGSSLNKENKSTRKAKLFKTIERKKSLELLLKEI